MYFQLSVINYQLDLGFFIPTKIAQSPCDCDLQMRLRLLLVNANGTAAPLSGMISCYLV